MRCNQARSTWGRYAPPYTMPGYPTMKALNSILSVLASQHREVTLYFPVLLLSGNACTVSPAGMAWQILFTTSCDAMCLTRGKYKLEIGPSDNARSHAASHGAMM
jgi:hypothetical protein